MNFELGFLEIALKEWGKLDKNIREQFKEKFSRVLKNPLIPAAKECVAKGPEGPIFGARSGPVHNTTGAPQIQRLALLDLLRHSPS